MLLHTTAVRAMINICMEESYDNHVDSLNNKVSSGALTFLNELRKSSLSK